MKTYVTDCIGDNKSETLLEKKSSVIKIFTNCILYTSVFVFLNRDKQTKPISEAKIMSAPPQKFVQDHNGVRKLNPAYKQFMDAQTRAQQAAGTAPATNFIIPQMSNAIQALPVVATKEEVEKHLGPNTKIADTVNATEEMIDRKSVV